MKTQSGYLGAVFFLIFALCSMANAGSGTQGKIDLDSVVSMAVHNHPSVKAALAKLEGAGAAHSAAEWQKYPALTIQSENGTDQNGASQVVSQLKIEQPIWTTGKITASINAAHARQQVAHWAVYVAQDDIALKVIDIWKTLIFAYESNQVNLRTIARLNKYVQMMARRVGASVSPQIELELIAARLAQAQVDQSTAAATIRSSLARLSQITGTIFTVEDLALVALDPMETSFFMVEEQEIQDLFSGAVKMHPSVQRAKAEVRAAQYDVEVKKGEQFPAVYARYQRQMGGIPAVGTKDFALQIQYVPGAGLSSFEQIHAATAQLTALTEAEDGAYRDVKEEMVTDWLALRDVQDREATLVTMVEKSNVVLDSYERLFIAGKKNWQDVLNTVREVSQNELAQLNTKIQLHVLPYRLKLRMHTLLWQQGSTK